MSEKTGERYEEMRAFAAGWCEGRNFEAGRGPLRDQDIEAAYQDALKRFLSHELLIAGALVIDDPKRMVHDPKRESLANAAAVEVAGIIMRAAADPAAVADLVVLLHSCSWTDRSSREQQLGIGSCLRRYNHEHHNIGTYFEDFWPPAVFRLKSYLETID